MRIRRPFKLFALHNELFRMPAYFIWNNRVLVDLLDFKDKADLLLLIIRDHKLRLDRDGLLLAYGRDVHYHIGSVLKIHFLFV